MTDFIKNLAALIKVKTIITFVVVLVFAVMALTGKVDADFIKTVTVMVVSFYFGTQTDKVATK